MYAVLPRTELLPVISPFPLGCLPGTAASGQPLLLGNWRNIAILPTRAVMRMLWGGKMEISSVEEAKVTLKY